MSQLGCGDYLQCFLFIKDSSDPHPGGAGWRDGQTLPPVSLLFTQKLSRGEICRQSDGFNLVSQIVIDVAGAGDLPGPAIHITALPPGRAGQAVVAGPLLSVHHQLLLLPRMEVQTIAGFLRFCLLREK